LFYHEIIFNKARGRLRLVQSNIKWSMDILIFLGNGVLANVLLEKTKGHGSGWITIQLGWACALVVSVYCSWHLSGAHLNPAVTISFALISKISWLVVPIYLIGQFLGAMLGSFFVWIFYYPHWTVTPDPNVKLLCFCTQPAIRSNCLNFLAETMGTAVLLFGVLVLFDLHNASSIPLAPGLIGVLVFSIFLSLGGPTGVAINPARDLGPRCMHALLPIAGKGPSEWGYAWIPILAPILGGIIGAFIYKMLFL
jgi:glycerol uptake facilitator protein